MFIGRIARMLLCWEGAAYMTARVFVSPGKSSAAAAGVLLPAAIIAAMRAPTMLGTLKLLVLVRVRALLVT
ncbi:hypothetical protein MMUC44124_15115 [Mycolicibacterium mucogenicum DSM 44124]|nr:hypothetical protein MMUC44124_15115 [Mycolicibacterium mucogenicum DSM 44124]